MCYGAHTYGFNQSQLMATAFAAKNKWPAANLLRRRRYTHPQISISTRKRFENVQDSFQEKHIDLQGWTVWLVDDAKKLARHSPCALGSCVVSVHAESVSL